MGQNNNIQFKATEFAQNNSKVVQDYKKMSDDYGKDIDRLVKENKLTDSQFQTYTSEYCWYCGRPYSAIDGKRHLRTLKLTKKTRRTEGVRKITTTYTKTISVPECSQCKAFHADDDEKNNIRGIFNIIVGYLLVAGLLAYLCHTTGDTESVLIFGIIISLSLFMVVYLIGALVTWPFVELYKLITNEKEKNPQPTLRSQYDIPKVIQAQEDGYH